MRTSVSRTFRLRPEIHPGESLQFIILERTRYTGARYTGERISLLLTLKIDWALLAVVPVEKAYKAAFPTGTRRFCDSDCSVTSDIQQSSWLVPKVGVEPTRVLPTRF